MARTNLILTSSSATVFYMIPLLLGFIISLGIYFPVVFTEVKNLILKYGLMGAPVIGCVLLTLAFLASTDTDDADQVAKQKKTKYSLLGVGLVLVLPLVLFVIGGTFYIAGLIIG